MPGRPWREAGAALLVASALAVMVFRAGTFHHGAEATSQVTAAVLLLAFAWVGRTAFRDPLALATVRARWWAALPAALWLSVTASWLLSPVGRAGESIVIFLLPAAWAAAGMGHLLGRPVARRGALAGCAAVAVSAAAWALIQQPLHDQGRAALPIGHHNQLALVLVALLPPALLGAWRLPWPGGSRARWTAAAIVGSILIWTLSATGSMSGLLALALQVGAAAAWTLWRTGAGKWLVRVGALLVLVAALTLTVSWVGSPLEVPGPVQRLGAVLRLEDPSLLSRRTYAAAAKDGFAERPILGWGPGSSNWTLARHWRPAPGVHPPGEVITDAHSLLAQAPYELGAIGSLLLLAVTVRYGQRRLVELVRSPAPRGDPAAVDLPAGRSGRPRSEGRVDDPELLAAAMLGLLGTGVCLMFGVFAGVVAVPAALILNLGFAAAARGAGIRTDGLPASWPWPRVRIVVFVWLAAALAWSLERAWAARSYEHAIDAARAGIGAAGSSDGAVTEALDGALSEQAMVHLRAAVAADPRFPLYRARLDPWAAAGAADGLAPLWLLAGIAESGDAERRREALERACDLDPLSALAPFELMRLEREAGAGASDARVADRAARAILAEPLLLAAVVFEGDPDLRSEVHRGIQAWPGLPPGWSESFEELWLGLDWSNGVEGPPRDVLSIDADGRAAVSFSLFAFRRPPWPLSIGAVPLRSHRLEAIAAHDLPAATRLPQTAPDPFWIGRCGLRGEGLTRLSGGPGGLVVGRGDAIAAGSLRRVHRVVGPAEEARGGAFSRVGPGEGGGEPAQAGGADGAGEADHGWRVGPQVTGEQGRRHVGP